MKTIDIGIIITWIFILQFFLTISVVPGSVVYKIEDIEDGTYVYYARTPKWYLWNTKVLGPKNLFQIGDTLNVTKYGQK